MVNDTSCVSSLGKSVATQAVVPYPWDLSHFHCALFRAAALNGCGNRITMGAGPFVNMCFISTRVSEWQPSTSAFLTSIHVGWVLRHNLGGSNCNFMASHGVFVLSWRTIQA